MHARRTQVLSRWPAWVLTVCANLHEERRGLVGHRDAPVGHLQDVQWHGKGPMLVYAKRRRAGARHLLVRMRLLCRSTTRPKTATNCEYESLT